MVQITSSPQWYLEFIYICMRQAGTCKAVMSQQHHSLHKKPGLQTKGKCKILNGLHERACMATGRQAAPGQRYGASIALQARRSVARMSRASPWESVPCSTSVSFSSCADRSYLCETAPQPTPVAKPAPLLSTMCFFHGRALLAHWLGCHCC